MTPPRIQRLLEGRQLEAITADPQDVRVRWGKALASNRDSRLVGLSRDNAVTLGYQAAMHAATAVLETAGYRTRGQGGGHHHNTFYALAGLGLAGLETADVDSERIRKLRSGAFYAADETTPAQVAALHAWLDTLLPAARRAIVAALPALEATLPTP